MNEEVVHPRPSTVSRLHLTWLGSYGGSVSFAAVSTTSSVAIT